MPILKRDDGAQFAIYTYREHLSARRSSQLKKDIRALAAEHGQYARLYKQPDRSLEAIFSRDAGFLLSETIWHYFNKPQNLIFCEALTEKQQALVVIVHNNEIYLDAKLPFNSLADELAAVTTFDEPFDIYLFGNLPISENNPNDGFVFDTSLVKSFTRLDKAVLPRLALQEKFQLQPLELALSNQRIGKQSPIVTAAWALIIVLALMVSWEIYHPKVPKISPIVTENPYQSFYTALATPAPERQLTELINTLSFVLNVPGWDVKKLSSTGSDYSVVFTPAGGTVASLEKWAGDNNTHIQLTAQGAVLTLPSYLKPRPKPSTISPVQEVVAALIDKVDPVLPDKSVRLGNTESHGNYKTAPLSIQFSNASPDVVTLISRALTGLPLKLASDEIMINHGLLSGNFQLTAVGN